MTTPVTSKQYEINAVRLEKASMSALIICSMSLIGLITLDINTLNSDLSLQISLGCFAIALPSSCLGFMVGLERKHFGKPIHGLLTKFDNRLLELTSASLVLSMVGVILLFFHFSSLHGFTFLAATVTSWYGYHRLYTAVDREISREHQEEQKLD
jgi:EamA domain-containing membrane protein RarD